MPPTAPKIDSLATWPKKLITPLQLARYSGEAIRTIYYHIEIGVIAPVRRGGRIKISLAEAAKYVGEPWPPAQANKTPSRPASVQQLQTSR